MSCPLHVKRLGNCWGTNTLIYFRHLVQLIEFFFVDNTTLQGVTGLSPVMPTEDLWSEITSPSEITCLRKDTGLATRSDSKKSIRVGNTFMDYNIGVRVLRLILLLKWLSSHKSTTGRALGVKPGCVGSNPADRVEVMKVNNITMLL